MGREADLLAPAPLSYARGARRFVTGQGLPNGVRFTTCSRVLLLSKGRMKLFVGTVILGPGGRPASQIRSSVLDHVTRFLQHKMIHVFWIDGDCMKRKRPDAVEAMNIVYRYSKDIVGLLSAPLRTRCEDTYWMIYFVTASCM
jgi:hypothetical protein